MSTASAIKKTFEPITMPEIKELRQALTAEQWDQFGRECCAYLGVDWKPSR